MGMLVSPYRHVSSGTAPNLISGLAFWFDALDGSTVWQNTGATTPASTSNGTVALWQDKSGNGRHLANGGSSTTHPNYVDSSGERYLRFDGNGNALAYNPASANVPCATVIVAAHVGSATEAWSGLVTNNTDQATNVDTVFGRDNLNNNWDTTQAAGGGLANSTHFWFNQTQTASILGNAKAVYSADGTGHPGTLVLPTGLRVGNDRSIANRDFIGRIYGLVGYNSILSAANRNAVEAWMANRYGITF